MGSLLAGGGEREREWISHAKQVSRREGIRVFFSMVREFRVYIRVRGFEETGGIRVGSFIRRELKTLPNIGCPLES